jgi:hypothetical protein
MSRLKLFSRKPSLNHIKPNTLGIQLVEPFVELLQPPMRFYMGASFRNNNKPIRE